MANKNNRCRQAGSINDTTTITTTIIVTNGTDT